MHPRFLLIAAVPTLLTGCLMDQYNLAALEDDTGPFVEGDADVDADTDSDTDADVNIDIASVTPDYATTRGGVEITIVGGPFNGSPTVIIGDTQAPVTNSQESVITAVVPAISQTGTLDIEVTTTDGLGRLTDGFTVLEDGTGLAGAVGEFYWIDYKGDYWTPSPPDDIGYAWFGFIEPADFEINEFYANTTNGCVSDYTYSGQTLSLIDLSVSFMTLESGSKSVDFSWISSDGVYEKQLSSTSEFAMSADYTLTPVVPQNGWPEFGTGRFLYMPAAITLTEPRIDDQYLPYYSGSQAFRWSGGNDADYIILILSLLNGSDTSDVREQVTCVFPNTGAASVPSSVWNTYSSDMIMVVMAGAMKTGGGGTLDPNNSDVAIAGSNFVYGGAYTQ